jgi:GNAT superfamily N-acetyltransferase
VNTTHRSYSEELGDFHRLCRFFYSYPNSVRTYSTCSIGRIVDWKYSVFKNKLAYPAFCELNAHLWLDHFGDLTGFAISEGGDADFVILTMEGCRFMYEEILEWVLENWQERGPNFSTEITQNQALEAAFLEQRGFTCRSTFFTQHFDLTGFLPQRAPLEEGFTIVDMHSHPDYAAQSVLRANAFQHIEDLSPEQLQQRMELQRYSMRSPIYHPQTDLCVMRDDGRFAAGCEALIDIHNAQADIERVCTHRAFRKRGFARAVILECLHRLKGMGLRSASITGYSPEAIALYSSIGEAEESKAYVYARGA